MKKLMALLMAVAMMVSVVGALADVDAAAVADQPEFQVMNLGNYEYGKDYESLYDYCGKDITIADVREDEETGFGYITVDGVEHELGLDFLTMAMVYNTTPAGEYETEDDVYAAWWRLYITRWNYLLPEVPLYSNEYYDLYNAQIKGVQEHPTNPFWGPAAAVIDWSSEKADNSIILGSSTELSGQFRVPAFGKSSPGSSDNDVANLVTGLETVSTTKEGGYEWNDTVVKAHEETINEDGSLTYTITIYDDLKLSDGSAVNAKNYLAAAMAGATPVYTEAASRESSYRTVKGWKGEYQLYTGPGSEAGTKVFSGLRLLDDYTFSVTIPAEYANYFYKITYGGFSAEPVAAYLGEGVDIFDDGEGCYLSDEFYAKDEEGKYIQAAAIRKLCTDTSAENYAAYPWSGPYYVVSFDNTDSTATLKLNPYFKGNYEGATPHIETIIYRRAVSATQIEDFKAGGLDVIAAITGGADTDNALKLADESNGAYVYTHYSRAGYGKLGFRADYGPAQFTSVRQAIALCMDRPRFAKDFTGGYGGVVNGPYYTGSWMYKAAVEQGMELDDYATSADDAIAVLVEDGWVYNADGTDYSGEGVRYKAIPADAINENDKNYKSVDGTYKTEFVNGVYLMPLVINWYGTADNEFTDLLQTGFRQNANVAKAGMVVYNTIGDFAPMLDELYQQAAYGYYSGSPMYCAFNFATGFNSAAYDYAYNMTVDPSMYDDYSAYYIKDYADIMWLNAEAE
jgi:ABC-type transport system substrate-binding protein